MGCNKLTGNDLLANFLDDEDLIQKMQTVHELERRNRYAPIALETTYFERVNIALQEIPKEHKDAALAVFANVVYLTKEMLSETMSMLASESADWCIKKAIDLKLDVHFFAVDHPGLVDDLFEVGAPYRWHARQDRIAQRYFRHISSLLDGLLELPHVGKERKKLIREVFQKKAWLVLSDNCLSGGSVKSDVERLYRVRELMVDDVFPEILILVQVITEQAFKNLVSMQYPRKNIFYGLWFDNGFKINHEDCALFNKRETLEAVRNLCEWFGKEHFSIDNPNRAELEPIRNTLKKHREKDGHQNFAYGWRDSGYTIVAYKNCPTNSVPLLWFPVITDNVESRRTGLYVPPFPRNHSRFEQTTSEDAIKLKRIEENAQEIKASLWGD